MRFCIDLAESIAIVIVAVASFATGWVTDSDESVGGIVTEVPLIVFGALLTELITIAIVADCRVLNAALIPANGYSAIFMFYHCYCIWSL